MTLVLELAHSSLLNYGVIALYIVYVCLNWQRNKMPRAPRWLLMSYNGAASLMSFFYTVALLTALLGHTRLWDVACTLPSRSMLELYALSYVMRLCELSDTLLIVHSSRPLTFLHCFHHAATLWLAHVQVVDETPLQFLTLLINAAVHTLMYAFYAVTVYQGKTPRWKRLVTVAQLVQFALLIAVYAAVMPAWLRGDCYAKTRSVLSAFVLLTLYLGMFGRFYRRTYKTA
jgi:fatty acid elongase 3